MADLWFTAEELAGNPGVPSSSSPVLRKAKREGWESRPREGRGGGREYSLHSLPKATQEALLVQVATEAANSPQAPDALRPTPAAAAHLDYDRDALWTRFESAPESMKQRALEHHKAAVAVAELVDGGTRVTHARAAVCKSQGITKATLERYWTKVQKYERCDWLPALLQDYVGRTAKAELSEAAWNYFKADYLRLEKPAFTVCYERLKTAAKRHGWAIPSDGTVRRRIAEIPIAVRVLLRDGEHALMRRYPPQERSVKLLRALEWINGDGYQHNVFVRWPDGTIDRPKTWFWQDVHSRKMLTHRTDLTENTDSIRLSFGDLVEQFGIPHHATIDNTRAAANKWMTGGVPNRYRFKVKPDDPLGLFPMLDVKVHWTSVQFGHGHGQAKPIERAFGVGGLGEYIDKHPKLAGAFTGNNPNAKPENYGSKAIDLEVFLAVVAEGVKLWNSIDKRRTEICQGRMSFDQAFAESYARAPIRRATAEQRRLWLLTAEAVRVSETGTFELQAGGAYGLGKNRYGSEALLQHKGRKIVVRFDPDRLHDQVYAYTLDGRLIATCECIRATAFGSTKPSRDHNKHRRQLVKSAKAQAKALQQMSALEAARLLPDLDSPETPEPAAVQVDFRRSRKVVNGVDFGEEDVAVDDHEAVMNRTDEHILRLHAQWRKDQL